MLDTWWPLILGSFAWAYGIFLARQFIDSIPDSLRESASIDGAGEWYIFLKIILPLCGSVIATLVIFQVVNQWNNFLWPLVVVSNPKKQVISVGLAMFNASETARYLEFRTGSFRAWCNTAYDRVPVFTEIYRTECYVKRRKGMIRRTGYMRQLKLNKSGIIIPVMSLGTWAFGGDAIWGKTDEMQAIDTARRAVEMGIVQIDTAPAYGMGKSEEILGEALKGIRDKVILSTKCGLSWDEGNIGQLHVERDGHRIVRNLSAKSIRKDLENSLKRLKTEYIDIYYVHYPVFGTYAVPVEETMDELNRMKKEGKIRAIGASNMNPEVLNEYCTYADIEIIQEKYSLLDRKVEETLLPVCQERKNSVTGLFSPGAGCADRAVPAETGYTRSEEICQ